MISPIKKPACVLLERRVFCLANFLGSSRGGLHSVAQVFDTAAFDRATDPLLQFISRDQAEALVAYRGDPPLRNRIDELASKSTEGELTDGERAEYEGYVRANHFVAILQAKARKLLADGDANGPSNA
ncbi:MAG: hypothetical protein KJ000_16860 [Pirellulaceae bacterium]|nr:hypothetical protein [Pirellulaceae bacterium]